MSNALYTTVVGSYSVPDWYPVLAEAVAVGHLPQETFEDAKACGARAAGRSSQGPHDRS